MKQRRSSSESLAKYLQIGTDIIQHIRSGELKPGARVPSENEIIAQYGVSNTTARKALSHIEHQGFARRVKGRGTFVRRQEVVRSANKILSFTKNMAEAGYVPSTRLLHVGLVKEGYSVFINGRNYSIKGPAYKFHRLRFADEVPMLLEVRYVAASLCPDIDKQDLEGSLYEIYEREYGLHLTEIRQILRTTMMSSGTLEFFNLAEPIPCFLVDGVTFCGTETVLELERSVYRGDKYEFAVSTTSRARPEVAPASREGIQHRSSGRQA